ncbi:hypothetical protein [Spirosoma jeollabukense]
MKKYLLDTHILIWWLTDSPDLQAPVKMILQNGLMNFTSAMKAFVRLSSRLSSSGLIFN